MARQSGMLKRMQAREARRGAERISFAIQMGMDAGVLAVNEVFGAGEKRAAEFCQVYNRIVNEIAEMTDEDARGDKEIAYTKAKVDQGLKRILGDRFHPWEERYGN